MRARHANLKRDLEQQYGESEAELREHLEQMRVKASAESTSIKEKAETRAKQTIDDAAQEAGR